MMKTLLTIAAILISSLSYGQGIWTKSTANVKQNRLMADSVLIVPRDTGATNNALYQGNPQGNGGRIAWMHGRLWIHNGVIWDTLAAGADLSDYMKYSDSAAMLLPYFRTADTTGKWKPLAWFPGVSEVTGLQDSLNARWDSAIIKDRIGYINIEWFGSIADSTVDATIAVQDAIEFAIANGKGVYIPNRVYSVSKILIENADGINIFSDGGTFKGSGDTIISVRSTNDFTIKGLKVRGTGSSNGISLNAVGEFDISDCRFNNLETALHIVSTNTVVSGGLNIPGNNSIHHIVVDNCAIGVQMEYISQYTYIQNSNISRCSQYGLYVLAGNTMIQGNQVVGCGIGIYVKGTNLFNSDHGAIVGNVINHNFRCGILLEDIQHTENVTSNQVWATIGDGTPDGNYDTGTGLESNFGIYVKNSRNANITSNTIARNRVNIGLDGWCNTIINSNSFIADDTRTTNNIIELGTVTTAYGTSANNIITGNIFEHNLTVGNKNIVLLPTISTKPDILMRNNRAVNEDNVIDINSSVEDYTYDGSMDYMTVRSSHPDSIIIDRHNEKNFVQFFFVRDSAVNKRIYIRFATSINSYTPTAIVSGTNGVDFANRYVTLSRSGLYHFYPTSINADYVIASADSTVVPNLQQTIASGATATSIPTFQTRALFGTATNDATTVINAEGGLIRGGSGFATSLSNQARFNTDATGAYIANDVDGRSIRFLTTSTTSAVRVTLSAPGNMGVGTSSPTSRLDAQGATGYNQLRLRTTYTPTSSADSNGSTGDVSWDDSFFYIKTSAGWKRSSLTAF